MINNNYYDGFHVSNIPPEMSIAQANWHIINGSVTIYTVPAGYIAYIVGGEHSCDFAAGAAYGQLSVYSSGAAWQYYLSRFFNASIAGHEWMAFNFFPAIQIPAGWYLVAQSTAPSLWTTGHVILYTAPI